MRSLLVTTVSPVEPRQGDEWRAYGLLKGLQHLGSVDIIQWGGRDAGARRFVADPLAQRLGRAVMGLPAGPPLGSLPYRSGFPEPDAGPYEVVAAYPLKAARWALHIPARTHVLDLTDSLGLLRERLPSFYWRQRLRLLGAGREEVRLASQFTDCWVASEADAKYLRHKGLEASVVPNGAAHRNPLPWADPRQLLFVGNLSYPPNRQGLQRFLRDIWPTLARQGYRLDLVGRGTERVAAPVVAGVTGHGLVDDLEAFYRSHGIAVSPVEVGTGTPSKVLEALSFGRPVVAWASGVLGLSEAERPAVVTVDRDELWLGALERLQDRAEWDRLAHLAPASVSLWGEAQAARLKALADQAFSTTSTNVR